MGDEPQTPTTPETPAQPSAAQKRINELYGKYKQAEEQTAAFEAQNAELRSQLATLQEEFTALKSQRQTPPPADPFAQPAANPVSGLDIEKIVSTAVERAVGTVKAEQQQRDQVQQLRSAQVASFQRAAQNYPALGDPQSELNRTASEILKLDKYLQAHPDGPFLAAAVAQGFLTQPTPAPTPEQKLLAVQQPTGTVVPQAGEKKDSPEAITKRMAELMKISREGFDPETGLPLQDRQTRDIWFEHRALQQKLADMEAAAKQQ